MPWLFWKKQHLLWLSWQQPKTSTWTDELKLSKLLCCTHWINLCKANIKMDKTCDKCIMTNQGVKYSQITMPDNFYQGCAKEWLLISTKLTWKLSVFSWDILMLLLNDYDRFCSTAMIMKIKTVISEISI